MPFNQQYRKVLSEHFQKIQNRIRRFLKISHDTDVGRSVSSAVSPHRTTSHHHTTLRSGLVRCGETTELTDGLQSVSHSYYN